MREWLLASVLATGLTTAALAEVPAGGFSLRSSPAAGFSLIADAHREQEEAGVGRIERATALAGLSFGTERLSTSAAIGSLAWSYPGAGEGTATLVTFALSHRTVGVAGGMLSLELRQSYLLAGESQLAITEARLGWFLRF